MLCCLLPLKTDPKMISRHLWNNAGKVVSTPGDFTVFTVNLILAFQHTFFASFQFASFSLLSIVGVSDYGLRDSFENLGRFPIRCGLRSILPWFLSVHVHRFATKSVIGEAATTFNCLQVVYADRGEFALLTNLLLNNYP